MADEVEVSVWDFLKYDILEFRDKKGEDPQEFLEEIEKVIRRLPSSSKEVVELVGMKMKRHAWDWFQRHIEDWLYGDSPPT